MWYFYNTSLFSVSVAWPLHPYTGSSLRSNIPEKIWLNGTVSRKRSQQKGPFADGTLWSETQSDISTEYEEKEMERDESVIINER